MTETRTIVWSVKRELWENRSICIAPMAVAAAVMFGFLISLIWLPQRMQAAAAYDAAKQQATVSMPFNFIAGFTILTAFVVGFFYCLDAMTSERRDRSILFWKSLPVSDRVSVLSKAGIPLVVLPVYAFAIIVVSQLIMLMLSTVVLTGSSGSVTLFWTHVKFVQGIIAMGYALVAIALWHAPIYGWLLLISGWVKRAAFLWAVMPFFAIAILERMAFNTVYFSKFVEYRLVGWFMLAYDATPRGAVAIDPIAALTPGKFLSSPGLWLGLIFAAACFAAAVRLRRNREAL